MYVKGMAAGLAASALLATAATAQSGNCAARTTVIGKLASSYGEAFSGGGLQNSDRIYEVWISEDQSTWTIIMTHANGLTCVMAAGTHWREGLPTEKEPEGIPG